MRTRKLRIRITTFRLLVIDNIIYKKTKKDNFKLFLEKFSRLEAQRLEKEGKLSEVNKKLEENKNKQILVFTHFNVFMYAACFFMQSGTLPVSITIFDLYISQIIYTFF